MNWLRLEANEGDINQYIRSQGLAESPRTLRVRGGDQGSYSEFVRIILLLFKHDLRQFGCNIQALPGYPRRFDGIADHFFVACDKPLIKYLSHINQILAVPYPAAYERSKRKHRRPHRRLLKFTVSKCR